MKLTSSLSPLLVSLFLAVSTLAAPGCQADGDDVTPEDARESELASMKGTVVEIVPTQTMDPAEFEAVAKWLEAESQAHMVKVRMMKESEADLGRLEVEIWGEQALAESLDGDLRTAFPSLQSAEITQVHLDGPPPQGEGDAQVAIAHDAAAKEEDPEALKARIIEEMRAKGVEGDIIVDVVDGPEGERRVEVRVEQDKEAPAPQ